MRIHTSLPFTFLLLFVANACEPSPYPDDVDKLVARWGAVRGDFIERCVTPHTLNGPFARAAEPTLAAIAAPPASRTELEAAFRQYFLDPDRQLDRDAFERCVAAHQGLPACPSDPLAFFARAGCAQLFVGAHEEGDSCASNALCAPGLFCDAPVGECGRCAPDLSPAPPLLRPCDDDPMCGVPIAPQEAGAACDVNCGNGLYASLVCVEGVCVQRRVIDVGGACDSFFESSLSLRHCREQDFGSTTCRYTPDDTGGAAQCVAVVRDGGGAFVPGAAVVSSAVGDGVGVAFLDCAP